MSQIRSPRSVRRRPTRTRCRLQLECLEDRLTPSVTVTTTLDPATPIAGQISLREAINMVNAGQVADNTIILPAGTYQNMQGALNVTHSLNLQGAGPNNTIIDGNATDRVVLIDPTAAVNVQLSGVTVRDGNTGGDGGGIDVQDVSGQSSVLTVQNSIITGNTAVGNGGGIIANDGDINVINSQITDNQAGGNGFGGAIDDSNLGTGNVTLTNSVITGNSGFGAISEESGGHGALTVTGCMIRDNTLTATLIGGGGIFANTTGAIHISDTTIQGNTSATDGGGFLDEFNASTNIVFSNDTIDNNRSLQGNGGGIAIETASNVTFQNSTISGNTAAQSGGGLFLGDTAGTTTLQDSTVSGNTAVGFGGGIEDLTLMLTATNSIFSNNFVRFFGGGIHIGGSANQTVSLTNDTLIGNGADGDGGGLEDSASSSTVTIASCLFANNATPGAGGGIDQAFGTLTVRESQFTGNVAGGGGALLFIAATPLTVSDSTFNNNQAGEGGALDYHNGGGTSSLTNDTFTGNTAGGNGGAVVIKNAVNNSSNNGLLALANDTINGNAAVGDGGGVSDEALGTHSFQNTLLADNTAGGNGPDVFTGTGLSITNNGGNFIGNLGGSTGFAAGTLTGNPLLGPLADNGGILAGASGDQQVVQTEALLPGSPAIGKGSANGAPTTDERGFNRIAPPDIGAFQFQNVALSVTVTPATPTVAVNGTETFTITVTNTSGNALPADNSTLTATPSAGLTTTGPLTFTLAALAAGQSQTFTVTATAATLGTQTLTAAFTSPDANPNTVSGSAAVTVVAHLAPISPPPPTTQMPVGGLTLFGLGFGPTGLDLFEIDGQGDVFAQGFGLGGISGSPQLVAADAVFRNLALMNGALVADLVSGNGQSFLMEVLNFSDPFVFRGLLTALFAGR